ncbi:hypothetical protein MoryE10_08050 [Methylogaea oryzae]|uniref:Uncharacterized protein n=1 Tax=Methylogaea oryzae TaxID=1295382 RepID=A0A8D5AIX7_9GAMM|nr:hypothetical protein MoryE10_08050 [Methylogaea oryzae]
MPYPPLFAQRHSRLEQHFQAGTANHLSTPRLQPFPGDSPGERLTGTRSGFPLHSGFPRPAAYGVAANSLILWAQ